MRQNLRNVGVALQRGVVQAERSIDEGIIAQLGMAATLLNARLEMGLNARVERELIADVGATLGDLFAHRERTIEIHERFSALAEKMGIDPKSFGDGGAKDLRPTGISLVRETAAA